MHNYGKIMFANIFQMTHVSNMTLDKEQLLYFIMQGITVDVAELIFEEIPIDLSLKLVILGPNTWPNYFMLLGPIHGP